MVYIKRRFSQNERKRYSPKYVLFGTMLRQFENLHKLGSDVKKHELRKHVRLRRTIGDISSWCNEHPNKRDEYLKASKGFGDKVFVVANGKLQKQRRMFFMKHGDEILTSTGSELNQLAKQFGIDANLPVVEKQEQVYQAMGEAYLGKENAWTPERITRYKKHFLETLEKSHFVNLTCRFLQINESVVRKWMQTDTSFAESVRSTQRRFGERVAHATLVKALNGDLGAQMYVLKQFGDNINYVEPESGPSVRSDGIQVDNLTSEEQETLLRLMRKAQETTVGDSPTHFIEDEISQIATESVSGVVQEDYVGLDQQEVD